MSSAAKLLRHVVMFKFKDGTDKTLIDKCEQDFKALPSKINVIKDFEWGTDVSGEQRNKGFTHCFVVTFLSKEDLDNIYIPHPAHREFVEGSVKPIIDDILVIDYYTS